MTGSPSPASPALRRFAWGFLAFNVAVILWGAYVRATGSGAGCGAHWPLCNGEIVPRAKAVETLIEFSHRLTSGLAGVGSIILLVWSWRSKRASRDLRIASALTFFFMLTEGAVGAGLVLFRLVAEDQSMARAWAMSAHLINTFLLLLAMTLAARAASGGALPRLKGSGAVGGLFVAAAVGVIVLGVSGAITALGDTLFPAGTLAKGLAQDLSPTSHLFLRLRLFHPLIAAVVGLLVVGAAWHAQSQRPSPGQRRWAVGVTAIVGAQLLAGMVNLLLLAPVGMQLLHLLLADGVWIALILAGANALGQESAEPALESAGALSP